MDFLRRFGAPVALPFLAVVGCLPGGAPLVSTTPPDSSAEVTVIRVFDGDTIEVDRAGTSIRIRLIGINAPEMGECYFDEAARHLRSLLESRPVTVDTIGSDRFGRVLAEVRAGEMRVNLDLVATGHAIATTPLSPEMATAESTAQGNGLGLWGPAACGSGPLPAVVIRRVEFNPPGPDELALEEEWVSLVNQGPSRVDLSGWTLRDESSLHRFRFPEGAALDPGGQLTITSGDPNWTPGGSPVWNNDGDIVILQDRSGRVVAAHRY